MKVLIWIFLVNISKFNRILFTEFVESIPVEKIDAQKFYGSEGDKIERLENNLQSEFDKFCLMKKPVLWPSLAFNLSVPGKGFVNILHYKVYGILNSIFKEHWNWIFVLTKLGY